MKNKRVFMGCAALIAAIGIVLGAGCAQGDENEPSKSILITGIPATHTGRTISLELTQITSKAYGEETISGDMVIIPLTDITNDQPFTGFGPFEIEFTITGGQGADESYKTKITSPVTILGELTAKTWNDFEKVVITSQPQKKITITEIPDAQNDKPIALSLLSIKDGSEKASTSGTISNRTSTLSLTAPNSQTSFTGSGLYTVKVIIDNNSQGIYYETVKLVTGETTTVPLTSFGIKVAK